MRGQVLPFKTLCGGSLGKRIAYFIDRRMGLIALYCEAFGFIRTHCFLFIVSLWHFCLDSSVVIEQHRFSIIGFD